MTWRAISINKKHYNKPVDSPEEMVKRGHVKINLFLPPTDIPNCVIATVDESQDKFKIEFQYTIPEKTKYLFSTDEVSFAIGHQSGKPLRIEINHIKRDKIDKVELKNIIFTKIPASISQRMPGDMNIRAKTNLERTSELLKEKADEIVMASA